MNTVSAKLLLLVASLAPLIHYPHVHASHRVSNAQLFNDYEIDLVSTASIYRRDIEYIWLDDQQPSEQARIAIEFIAGAPEHGLDREHYHYRRLQQLDPAAGQTEAQLFDLLLTDGLLKLIRDIAVGRLDPAAVDPKWTIPRPSFDAAAYLQNALLVDHFKDRLNALVPESKQYRLLMAAAKRYQAYVARGGWNTVPDTPVLRPGDVHQNIPAVRARLAFEDNAFISPTAVTSTRYDEPLEQAVIDFQRSYGLKVDGKIGPETLRAMNVSAADRLQQIRINLERLRWLPDDLGKRYILVNLANYRLTAIDEDKIELDMRVIVGQAKRQTPSFYSKMTHVVFNPYWNVPRKLARLDLLPRQQSDPDYFGNYKIRIFDYSNGERTEVEADSIDWSAMDPRIFPYSLRQDPGEKNALGQLKFLLPNQWAINLHDTPVKSLFERDRRNFSSGCIRVEDPLALANFSLGDTYSPTTIADIVTSNERYSTPLAEPLPVYAVYVTVWPRGDELVFTPDVYRRDQRMADYL